MGSVHAGGPRNVDGEEGLTGSDRAIRGSGQLAAADFPWTGRSGPAPFALCRMPRPAHVRKVLVRPHPAATSALGNGATAITEPRVLAVPRRVPGRIRQSAAELQAQFEAGEGASTPRRTWSTDWSEMVIITWCADTDDSGNETAARRWRV